MSIGSDGGAKKLKEGRKEGRREGWLDEQTKGERKFFDGKSELNLLIHSVNDFSSRLRCVKNRRTFL